MEDGEREGRKERGWSEGYSRYSCVLVVAVQMTQSVGADEAMAGLSQQHLVSLHHQLTWLVWPSEETTSRS